MSQTQAESHKDLSDRMMSALHLEAPPVTVLWTINSPEGIPCIDASKKGCQFLDVARFERRTFYTDTDNRADCKNGRYYLVFTPAFEGLGSGDWPGGDYPDKGRSIFRSPAAFRRTLSYYTVVPSGTVNYIVFGPLDLRGMIVAVSAFGSHGDITLRADILPKGGLSVKDITPVEIPTPQMEGSLLSRAIHAALVYEPFGTRMSANKELKVLSWMEDTIPSGGYIISLLLMQEAYAKANPEVVNKFRRPYAKGGREAKREITEAMALSSSFLRLPPEVLEKAKPHERPADGQIRVEIIQELAKRMKALNIIEREPEVKDFVWPEAVHKP